MSGTKAAKLQSNWLARWSDLVKHRPWHCTPPLAWSCGVPQLCLGQSNGPLRRRALQAVKLPAIAGYLNRHTPVKPPIRDNHRKERHSNEAHNQKGKYDTQIHLAALGSG